MAMKIAVYNVPPSPNNEKGARELKLRREHNGNKTIADNAKITLERELNNAGTLKV